MRKVLAALLVAAVLVGAGAMAVDAQTFYQKFENVWVKTLRTTGATTVGSTLAVTGATTVGGALAVTGNATFAGTSATTGQASFSDDLYLIPGDAITVTDGGTVTPATAAVELTAAGAVGAQMAAAVDGRVAILINTVNQTITISDTGSAKLAGDFAMGQYDTLTLLGQGVVWHEIARSNN